MTLIPSWIRSGSQTPEERIKIAHSLQLQIKEVDDKVVALTEQLALLGGEVVALEIHLQGAIGSGDTTHPEPQEQMLLIHGMLTFSPGLVKAILRTPVEDLTIDLVDRGIYQVYAMNIEVNSLEGKRNFFEKVRADLNVWLAYLEGCEAGRLEGLAA
jgi:hypothetical protein